MQTMLPHAQAQFRLGKVNGHPVKLSFGFGKQGGNNKTGAIFGIGVEMSGDRQLFRMDYDPKGKNDGHGGAIGVKKDEIKVLRDKNSSYHMHVYKWERGNNGKKAR